MEYNGTIETLQLKVLSKSDNKKEMAHDMDLLKEYQKTIYSSSYILNYCKY